ncbi:UNVERIFIED_CONTAM: Retrovirus-related Pol polyprotein from transposon TNT 1-94 [Sesamum angustifolium]|uniref:Retrovirus-related Pol polyprotein from transposon TNT 1-94 n=1 Tax=Sesamum angustifolium TaxID=2727405 RepID=A0AAW2MJZ7_9LAMI
MDPPEGYLVAKPGQVCRLRRSLYGLKQASRQWNLELTTKLLNYGFTQSAHDNCLFLKHTGSNFIALLVYMDDILLTSTSESSLHNVKQYLDGLFTIKDLGSAKYFLGLELARSSHGLLVTQHKYLQDILSDTSMLNAKNSLCLTVYSNAAWASCPDSRRSITGFYVFLGGSLISWKTKKQATVSHSSAKVEYRSMASTVCELMWISYLLQDFLIPVQRPIPFWCDNKAALHITANPVFHERTKHLDIDCHLVRNQFKCGFIAPSFIREPDQPADFFTKALHVSVFARLLFKWDYVPNL